LRAGAEALLQHVLDRWTIENSWHCHRETQLSEDAHRYSESNGVRIMATLRSLAMNALQLDGYWSITEGLAALVQTSGDFWHCWAGENQLRHSDLPEF